MAYYLFTGSYSIDAIKTMVDNPQDREAAARAAVEAIGGKLHSFFFTFGESDVIAIVEIDDDVSMAAMSFAVAAGGALAHGATTKLLTSAEAMAALARAKKARGKYKPPSARKRG
jgi:uncharacterized protein with GYD domain